VLDALQRIDLSRVLEPIPMPLLEPSQTLRDAARLFARSTSDVLYVSHDGRTLDGLVTLEGLLGAHAKGALPRASIGELMVERPLALPVGESCATLLMTMREHMLISVPIVHDTATRALAGSVTLRGLTSALLDNIEG
jgi:CBS domain-containing protein